MELHEALSQISEIRQQVARGELFRGYRALPVVFSGVLAFVAASVQAFFRPSPPDGVGTFLAIWLGCAVLSAGVVAIEMIGRMRRTSSRLENERVLLAIGQFLPSVAAGGLIMLVILRFAPENAWMLPGLWAILFGLGVFASWRFLPHLIVWVGAYYLAAGLVVLAFGQGDSALAPWTIAVPFGFGQLFTAAALYWTLERRHEQI